MHYGQCPELVIDGLNHATMAYVPVHLEYILAELFKNAIRATIERHVPESERGLLAFAGDDAAADKHLPPIKLTIAQTPNDVAIRIRDEGGGVPYENLAKIFEYSYTTVKKAATSAAQHMGDESPHAAADTGGILGYASEVSMQQGTGGVLAGLGYGLGMARVYSRYFGGSLRMVSLYGHGCDVFLRLPNIDQTTAKDVKI
ncbi:histidine kinase-like ATPase [Catenaria anguillulae PL171]|uniref:Protein-serine/threonine kinase n=1 Tax=Catenaria anguillulae PL171 TaxID=765915 RepID=A0A1Y2HIX9_9FUNG|nr:histidine kinase-like ATPase [Catenaria anguillulae PL171]